MDRQRELIRSWAETNGHEVVAWAEDVDVSGSISPFDAPELGPFLTDEGAEAWDILVAWKLDRLARNAVSLHRLFGWIQDNNKQLVCISDNIDLSTWVGRMVAGVIAGVAEGELEAITERVTAGQKALRESGRFRGGTPPYGYKQAQAEVGWKIEKDEEEQKVLQRMIREALSGSSFLEISNGLNEDGILTKRGKQWTATAVDIILTNKALLGWTVHNGQTLLDAEGAPIVRGPASITLEDFTRIQELKKSRSFVRTSPESNSPLLGVIECWECGKNMHFRRGNKGPSSDAYRCAACDTGLVNARYAESILEELFLDDLEQIPVMKRVKAAQQDSGAELEEARTTYSEIAGFLPSAPDEASRTALFEQLKVVGDRITRLEKQKKTPAGDQWVDTGETYGGLWTSLDQEGRRRMMVEAGVRFRVRLIERGTRWKKPVLETELRLPNNLREILSDTRI